MDMELKPCPKCGSPAELKQSHYLESDKPYSFVHCTNKQCALNHEPEHFGDDTQEKNDEKAVAAWNKRA